MPIFYEPDVTKYPQDFNAIKCTGLEQLTGADIVIAKLPILPTQNLQTHINTRSLFVQIKIGYDICSFDNLKSSIARMMKCKIPKGQAILLPIGEYWQDENGLLRLKGQKPFGSTQYSTLSTIYDMWSMRGGIVEPLPPKTVEELSAWIEQKQKSIEKIEKEGKREIYPQSPTFISDDIWQVVEEINDWRRFFVSGLEGFGNKKARAIYEYAKSLDIHEGQAYRILCLTTDENENGKPLHKIPLWGDASRKAFRQLLGIPDGWNLSELSYRIAFYSGWKAFGNDFKTLVERKKKPLTAKEAHRQLMDMTKQEVEEDTIPF